MNIPAPKLRFPGLADEWHRSPLKALAKIYDGTHQTPNYVDSGIPFYSVEQVTSDNFTAAPFIAKNVYEQEIRRVALERGDILMTRIGDVGTVKLIDWDVKASFYVSLALIKQSPRYVGEFMAQYMRTNTFQRELWRRTIHVAFPKKINLGEIGECVVALPSSEEQERIAEFLKTIDARMLLIKRTLGLLRRYKTGIMQKVFSRQIRFKNRDGNEYPEWDQKSLAQVVKRVTARNGHDMSRVALTNSAAQGIVMQSDFFEKNIASHEDLTNYHVVDSDDFVYNPRISSLAPVGPIRRNHLQQGVMSPLYTVFRFTEGNLDFFEAYFWTNLWHEYIKSIASSGARHDRMNITTQDFYDMPIPYPCDEEQQKIAEFLTSIDGRITLEESKLEQAVHYKEALLQQMFL